MTRVSGATPLVLIAITVMSCVSTLQPGDGDPQRLRSALDGEMEDLGGGSREGARKMLSLCDNSTKDEHDVHLSLSYGYHPLVRHGCRPY